MNTEVIAPNPQPNGIVAPIAVGGPVTQPELDRFHRMVMGDYPNPC